MRWDEEPNPYVPAPSHLPAWIPFAFGWAGGGFFTAGIDVLWWFLSRHLK